MFNALQIYSSVCVRTFINIYKIPSARAAALVFVHTNNTQYMRTTHSTATDRVLNIYRARTTHATHVYDVSRNNRRRRWCVVCKCISIYVLGRGSQKDVNAVGLTHTNTRSKNNLPYNHRHRCTVYATVARTGTASQRAAANGQRRLGVGQIAALCALWPPD